MNIYVEKIREIALENKYKKWYCNIINLALLRGKGLRRKELVEKYGYVELHHILPKSFEIGGNKDKENIVFLTGREHFIVHLLATKMFESKFRNKMIFAFRMLLSKNVHQKRYFNSRFYSAAKVDRKRYIRLYNKESIKYIDIDDKNIINELINNGWVYEMTEEYKVGRVGNMVGRKHSSKTKEKMSQAAVGKSKPYLLGVKKSKECIEKAKKTRQDNKIKNPEFYSKGNMARSKKRQEALKNGLIKVDGENNGMFGKRHSEETKVLIALKAKERHKKKLELLNNSSLLH